MGVMYFCILYPIYKPSKQDLISPGPYSPEQPIPLFNGDDRSTTGSERVIEDENGKPILLIRDPDDKDVKRQPSIAKSVKESIINIDKDLEGQESGNPDEEGDTIEGDVPPVAGSSRPTIIGTPEYKSKMIEKFDDVEPVTQPQEKQEEQPSSQPSTSRSFFGKFGGGGKVKKEKGSQSSKKGKSKDDDDKEQKKGR